MAACNDNLDIDTYIQSAIVCILHGFWYKADKQMQVQVLSLFFNLKK